jgi:uroporphyrinogen III methyltransferase/synthase
MTLRTLEGRVVVLTRARAQGEALAGSLRMRGAVPLLAPAIELRPAPPEALDRASRELVAGAFAWVLFTSRAGVEAVLGRTEATAGGVPARMAAIGEGTAGALRERGIEPDLVPDTFTTEALARAMPAGSGRVLLPRADIAPEGMEEVLAGKGWEPVRVDAYLTKFATKLPVDVRRALRDGRADAITFTSASTVRGFVGIAGEAVRAAPRRPRVICIGPVTARTAREAGLRVDAVARPHTIDGLVAALERILGRSLIRDRKEASS